MEYTELTPFDYDLARMVASLTMTDCTPQPQKGNFYLLNIEFAENSDELYRQAVIDALKGKAGKRLIKIGYVDDSRVVAKIRKSTEKLPQFYRGELRAGQPEAGEEYCRIIERVRALQFNRFGVNRLIRFVGNGEMEVPEKGYATFHFLNASGSVWEHAEEGDYIVYNRPGHYEVMSAEAFEKQFEK